MLKICIDPGHGKKHANIGYSKKYIEDVGVLQLSILLKEELLPTGAFEVLLTRTTDIDLSLLQRARIAANFKADMLISEHSNAGPVTATGTEVLRSIKRPLDKPFAEALTGEVAKALGIVNRGVKTKEGSTRGTDYFGILRYGVQYGIPHVFIIESAFHSNLKEEAMLLDPQVLRKIAQAQARAICNFYKVQYPVVKKVDKAKSPGINDQFRVYGTKLLGNGLTEEYAKTKAQQLKDQGYLDIYYIKPDETKIIYK